MQAKIKPEQVQTKKKNQSWLQQRPGEVYSSLQSRILFKVKFK